MAAKVLRFTDTTVCFQWLVDRVHAEVAEVAEFAESLSKYSPRSLCTLREVFQPDSYWVKLYQTELALLKECQRKNLRN